MEERETQARKGAGGRASAVGRWLPFSCAAALVALAVIAAPAGGGITAKAGLAPQTITASNYSFGPNPDVMVDQGETVTWTNMEGTHNVVFQGSAAPFPPSPPNSQEWPHTVTFSTPGTFRFYCEPHVALGMEGTVTVNPVTPPPGGPPPPGGTPPPGGSPPPPGSPPPGAPGAGKTTTTVTLQVSDATPARGARVRLFGTVRPAQDGRLLQLQRRAGRGSYRTVARIKLAEAGASRSKFSKRLRVLKDTVFRARLSADSTHAAGTSRTRRVNVP
jgi:plastocyanin